MIDTRSLSRLLSHPYATLGLRVFIGLTFILSSVSKLPHHTEFVKIVESYELLPEGLAAAYGNVLPWVELILGVYLLLGIMLRPTAVVTLLIAVSFLVANIDSLASGEDHCGSCFGDIATLPLSAAMTLDILILAAAVILIRFGSRTRGIDLRSLLLAIETRRIHGAR